MNNKARGQVLRALCAQFIANLNDYRTVASQIDQAISVMERHRPKSFLDKLNYETRKMFEDGIDPCRQAELEYEALMPKAESAAGAMKTLISEFTEIINDSNSQIAEQYRSEMTFVQNKLDKAKGPEFVIYLEEFARILSRFVNIVKSRPDN